MFVLISICPGILQVDLSESKSSDAEQIFEESHTSATAGPGAETVLETTESYESASETSDSYKSDEIDEVNTRFYVHPLVSRLLTSVETSTESDSVESSSSSESDEPAPIPKKEPFNPSVTPLSAAQHTAPNAKKRRREVIVAEESQHSESSSDFEQNENPKRHRMFAKFIENMPLKRHKPSLASIIPMELINYRRKNLYKRGVKRYLAQNRYRANPYL